MTVDAVPGVPAEGAAVPEPSAPNIVNVGPCRCPKTPHPDGDVVFLYPEIPLALGVAGMAVLRAGGGVAAVYGGLADVYLQLGIADWTFVDAKGQPEPVIAPNIARLLPFGNGGLTVADAADDLYGKDLLRPLVRERSERSSPTSTATSTSANRGSGRKNRTPSERSSRNGTHGKPSGVRGR
jgi:hypothetical protein